MKLLKLSALLIITLFIFSCKNSGNSNTDTRDISNQDSSVAEESQKENLQSSDSLTTAEAITDNTNTESENQSDYIKIINECVDKVDFAVDPSGVQNNYLSGGSSTEIAMKPGDKVRLINGGVIYTHTAGSTGPVYLCK
ncbi:MAG: hypothetical protein JNJ40_18535 [Bacteroidia bacterium]|nr:hypothetical protein [Bacteroidia bacterium]